MVLQNYVVLSFNSVFSLLCQHMHCVCLSWQNKMSYYNVLVPATMQAETFKGPQFTSRKIQKGLGCNRRV